MGEYKLYKITQQMGWPGFAIIEGYSFGRDIQEATKIYLERVAPEDKEALSQTPLDIEELDVQVKGFKMRIEPLEERIAIK